MRRLTEAWFEFNNARSDDMHARLMAMPKRPIAGARGEMIEVPGGDGYLWMGERGARLPIFIDVKFETADGWSADELGEWLQGGGLLRFSDEPDRAYRARIVRAIDRENRFLSFDRQIFTVRFECQPHRYLYPEADPVVLETSKAVRNPGTADSQPRITVNGSGDMRVFVNGQTIGISGGSVIIDTQLKNCFAIDGVAMANHRVTMDEYPVLKPGFNQIGLYGPTSVIVDGRWRYI